MTDDIHTKSPIEAAAEELYMRQPFYVDLKKGEYKDCIRNLSRLLVAIETAAYAGLEEARCHLTFELVLRYSKPLTALLEQKHDLVVVEHSLRVYGFYDAGIYKDSLFKHCRRLFHDRKMLDLEELCTDWTSWICNDTSFRYVKQKIPIEKWSEGSLYTFLKHRPLAEFEEIYPIIESHLTDSKERVTLDSRLMDAAIEDFIRTRKIDKVKFLVSKNLRFQYYHVIKILSDGLIPLLEFMHESKIDIPNNDASLPSLSTLKWLHEHKYDITHRIAISCTHEPLFPGTEDKLRYALEQKLPIHKQILFMTIQNDEIMLILLQDRVRIGLSIPSAAIQQIRSKPAKFPKSLAYTHDWACLPGQPKTSTWDWPIPHYAGIHTFCLD